MKSASSPETPRQNSRKKVSKPVMEKRRRERINHSLETLRLLMLENTQNEKLKNPKVEKAEILESVVEFLKTEKEMERSQQALKEVLAREQRASGGRHQSYRDGMKSCLLRVSQFIACKSLELEENGVARGGTFTLSEAQELAASSGHLHMSPIHIPADVPAALSSPPHHLTSAESSKAISSSSTAPVSAHITDPVWRPWPV